MLTKEHKKKISISLSGRKLNSDWKKKISLALMGREISKETHNKMKKAWEQRRLHGFSTETRLKMSASHLGKKHSEETKEKISTGNRGSRNGMYGRKGEKNSNWNGGIMKSNGYIYNYLPNHPFSNKHGYIANHRLIAEKVLGRYLKSNEVVHHLNGNKKDNRNSNLLICSNSYHVQLHHAMSDYYMKRHFTT